MPSSFTTAELEAYLDEALPSQRMAQIEAVLRETPALVQQLASITQGRSSGVHSLGTIWRRHRLTCPSRAELGSSLLGVLEPAQAAYIQFHVETVGCRLCQASLEDLRGQHQAADPQARELRRSKYFQSSAGYL